MAAGQPIPSNIKPPVALSRPEGTLKANPNAAKLAAGEGKTNWSTSQKDWSTSQKDRAVPKGTLVKADTVPKGTLMKADGTAPRGGAGGSTLMRAESAAVASTSGGGKGILLASNLKPNPLGNVVSGGASANLVTKATSALVKNPNVSANGSTLVKNPNVSANGSFLAKNPNVSANGVVSTTGAKFTTLFGNLPKKL